MSLRKVRSGDPLLIPAATYNAFIDAARDHRDRQHSTMQQASRESRQAGIVLVRNESGADRQLFDILGVAGPVVAPADNADAFKERIAIRGIVPTADHEGRFVVLLEPIATDAIGRAYAAGVCPVRVEMADEQHRFADVDEGETATLLSAETGLASLLWVEPLEQRADPAIAWALARLGGAGAGSSVIAGYVVGHGEPDGDGRIWSHIARPLVFDGHQGVPCYLGGQGAAEYEFSAFQPGGWFHPGQVVVLYQAGGLYKANCPSFMGIVSDFDLQGDPPAGVPRGLCEVTPFDGDPNWVPDFMDNVTQFPESRLCRVAQFVGSEITVGEPVLCVYIGQGVRGWIATHVPNLFGSPFLPDGSPNPEYANGPPPANEICTLTDPELPVVKDWGDPLDVCPPDVAACPEEG